MAVTNTMYGQQIPYNAMPTTSPYPSQPQYPLAPMPGPTGQPGTPAYGLAGANAALMSGMTMNGGGGGGGGGFRGPDYSQINANRDMAMQQANQGIRSVRGFVNPGMDAQRMQAALSGALGNEAQSQAYANFQSSPGQQWLQEQAERGVLRNAAAIGGLGGGNVRAELQRQAMGLAAQDFQNQFNRMGSVADRGMQGAQLQNNLYNMAGQAATSAGAQGAGVQSSAIGAAASRDAAASSLAAARLNANNALTRDMAQYAYGAGQDIASNFNSTTSALANLANQQGAGMSDMYGSWTGNIANLLGGAGGQQATSNANLAALLANIASGAGAQSTSLPGIPGVSQSPGMLGNIGNALSGAGMALSGWGQLRGAITPTPSGNSSNLLRQWGIA